MRYLIININSDSPSSNKVFYTEWFAVENNYVEGMMVIDKAKDLYTVDGKTWIPIEYDHL